MSLFFFLPTVRITEATQPWQRDLFMFVTLLPLKEGKEKTVFVILRLPPFNIDGRL